MNNANLSHANYDELWECDDRVVEYQLTNFYYLIECAAYLCAFAPGVNLPPGNTSLENSHRTGCSLPLGLRSVTSHHRQAWHTFCISLLVGTLHPPALLLN